MDAHSRGTYAPPRRLLPINLKWTLRGTRYDHCDLSKLLNKARPKDQIGLSSISGKISP
jgi:hypothetical protein